MKNKPKEKLKPCPFCGKLPERQTNSEDFYIVCANKKCFVWPYVGGVNEAKVFKSWNTRKGEK